MAERLSTFSGHTAYVDAVVLISHLDALHPLHDACSAFLRRAVESPPIALVTASLTFDEVAIVLLQELLARPPFRVTRDRTQYLTRHPEVVRDLAATLDPLLSALRAIVSVEPVTGDDVSGMVQAMRMYGMLPRDAIHLSVAERLGITAIVSADEVFASAPGMRLYKP